MSAFPKYDSYKASTAPWLSGVPEHWNLLPGLAVVKENKEKNVGMIEDTVLSLSYGKVVVKPPEKLTGLVPESFETYQVINPGDIIIRPTDLQNDTTSLRTGLANDRGIITSAYICLRPVGNANPKYLHYLLHAYDLMKVFYGLGSGLRQNLDYRDFKRLEFVVPPAQEQERIINFLDQKTAEIDAAIAKKQRLIELLKEQKAILINQAVTKGLNPNAPKRDSGVKWIGGIPAHWQVSRLKHKIRADTTVSYGIVQPGDHVEDGVPFLQTTNISKPTIDLNAIQRTKASIARQFPRTKLAAGDVILGIRASVGAAHVVPGECHGFNLSRGIARIVPAAGLHPEFLKWFLLSKATTEYWEYVSQGSTFSEVSIASVRNLPLLIPDAISQEEIVNYCAAVNMEIEDGLRNANATIALLDELRRSIIANAVTGKFKI